MKASLWSVGVASLLVAAAVQPLAHASRKASQMNLLPSFAHSLNGCSVEDLQKMIDANITDPKAIANAKVQMAEGISEMSGEEVSADDIEMSVAAVADFEGLEATGNAIQFTIRQINVAEGKSAFTASFQLITGEDCEDFTSVQLEMDGLVVDPKNPIFGALAEEAEETEATTPEEQALKAMTKEIMSGKPFGFSVVINLETDAQYMIVGGHKIDLTE
jgi:hypothetical protein